MKCPKCVEENKQSNLYLSTWSACTAMAVFSGYYDVDGNYVPPVDPNIRTTAWHCSNGHTGSKVGKNGKETWHVNE